jgi:quercetin dioxygenase-like cupin family protein
MILSLTKEAFMKIPLDAMGIVLAAALLGPAAHAEDAKAPAHKAGSRAVVATTPDELKWVGNPANANVSMAVLWGDPAKGPHGAFHRFKAGTDIGLHSHSSDMRLAVISGTMIAGGEGQPEKKLPPGSYEFQPHGVKHVTKCDPASDCVVFVVTSGKFDLTPAGAK